MKPIRVTRSRLKGWRKPPGTICVSRPSYWANPHNWKDHLDTMTRTEAKAHVVAKYREELLQDDIRLFKARELKGWNLMCWCRQDEPCHADVLLEVVNGMEDMEDA
jgi:hypothetical protein